MDSIRMTASGGHSAAATRSSAALNEPERTLPEMPTRVVISAFYAAG